MYNLPLEKEPESCLVIRLLKMVITLADLIEQIISNYDINL